MPVTPKRKAEAASQSPKPAKKARVTGEKETDAAALTPRRSTRTKAVARVVEPEKEEIVESVVTSIKRSTPKRPKIEAKSTSPEKKPGKAPKAAIVEKVKEVKVIEKPAKKATETAVEEETGDAKADGKTTAKQKQKRKTKEEKEAEMIPLATRTQKLKMFVGAHVSGAGGLYLEESTATDSMLTIDYRCPQWCYQL